MYNAEMAASRDQTMSSVKCWWCLLLAVLLSPTIGHATSVQEIFEKHALLGTFASDCATQATEQNQYIVHRVMDAEHVQRDQMIGPTTRSQAAVISAAIEAKPNEIAFKVHIDGQFFDVT